MEPFTNDVTLPGTPDNGEFGIANAKLLLTAIAAQVFAGATIDADGDGEVNTSEWTGFGTQLILAVLGNLSVGRNAFPEFGDIKGEEFAELTAHVLATDFLPNDQEKAERLVKTVLVLAYVNRLGVLDIQATLVGQEPETNMIAVFQSIIALEAK